MERHIDLGETRRIAAQINKDAIAEGIMLPNGQSSRTDYSVDLGKELSGYIQRTCYALIHQVSLKRPISSNELYKQLYGYEPRNDDHRNTVRVNIVHIKSKLGEESIISTPAGYITRSARNERIVKANKAKNSHKAFLVRVHAGLAPINYF